MSQSIRIRTKPNGTDNYVKVQINQEFDFIEVLSLKITQEDAYRNFCSDYGAIVGRVTINSGFGVPNAKVSVFIPLDDEDKLNPVIKGLYPYEVISDKNSEGVRYNLLPKNSETNNSCFSPIGTFPNKREILDNPELEYVYCKYYKFTTTTNSAGDFMFFGVPLGTHTIHVDADISDIGIASQRPYDLISQGTPAKVFESPTKYKTDKNLDKLVQVKTINYSVNVQPFWGDSETCEIGISRADIDMGFNIKPSAIFIGSIFGDSEKNSINKRCRPRKKIGELSEQVTSDGRIEMIRQNLDGEIENFDIENGDLIDSDGTWAYQIPMNLDYMVTDEFGNLVPSEDPNIGVPTRARVRFKIGMNNTGGEGRLRTRASFLVPNNPRYKDDIDYTFDSKTKDSNFRDIYWNKIYSVKNFIPRYQANGLENIRAFTGLKNIDSDGNKTPAPFNRVNTSGSALFTIICGITEIITFLIYVMNLVIIPVMNLIISLLNSITAIYRLLFEGLCFLSELEIPVINIKIFGFLSFTCGIADKLPEIKPISCIVMECPKGEDGEPNLYAPGCKKYDIFGGESDGWKAAAEEKGRPLTFYPGAQGFPENGYSAVGYDKCTAFQLAKSLDMFEYDFYGDWLNGSLFSFLIKYKKKRKGREKFCEYDCDDFFSEGGIDGNNDNKSDNKCRRNYLLDIGYSSDDNPNLNGKNSHKKDKQTLLKEGVIKKINTISNGVIIQEDFYYASSKHDVSYRLFATDLICLGSIFECDWQGIPKLQNMLVPTTYNLPPDSVEFLEDGQTVETTGVVTISPTNLGLFFDIDCLGLSSDYRQILNIRHICEYGVELDELREDQSTPPNLIPPDSTLGKDEIDFYGKYFRDVFYYLNKDYGVSQKYFNYTSLPLSTEFNTKNLWVYPFASDASKNGSDYLKFREYQIGSDTNYGQPLGNSYYFYFGLLPGKSAVEKMNKRFFTLCTAVKEKEFNIISNINAATSNNGLGTLTFNVVSGTAPFTYTLSGPQNSLGTILIDSNGQPKDTILNLPIGSYDLEVVDVNGNNVTITFVIDGPPSLYAAANVNKLVTNASSNDGEITINTVGGGSGTYTYTLYKSDGTSIVSGPSSFIVPYKITNLPVHIDSDGSNPANYGYILKVSDGNSSILIKNLKVDGPSPISITADYITDVTCYNGNNGKFKLNITGGKKPYTISTNGPLKIFGSESNNLIKGTYTTTVVDDYGTSQSFSFNINEINGKILIEKDTTIDLSKQCDKDNYYISFLITLGNYTNPKFQYSNNNVDFNDIQQSNIKISSSNSNIVTIKLPKNSFTNLLTIRMTSKDGNCYSNVINLTEQSIKLPIDNLSVNVTGIDNTKQCDPSTVSFKINISHLQANINYTERKPYKLYFKVNGGQQQIATINNYNDVITGVMSNNNGSAIITYYIEDNKGCRYPLTGEATLPTISVPTTALSKDSSGNPIGGIAPYTTGVLNYTDSVGCKILK